MATLVQTKIVKLSGQTNTVVFSMNSNVTAGNTLVLIGGAIKSDSSETARLTAVTGGGTWSSITNARPNTDYAPNAFGAVLQNATGGATSITLTLDRTSSVQTTLAVTEWSGVPTSSVLLVTPMPTGTAGSGTSTSTSTTGALTSTQGNAILGGFGWGGLFYTPSGWTGVVASGSDGPLPQQNGSGGFLGGHVVHRALTSGDASGFIGTMDHDASGGTSAIIAVIKDNSATLKMQFNLRTDLFTSADTNITGFVWVNGWPDTKTAVRLTSLAGSGTAGLLEIPQATANFPAGLVVGDTVRGIFSNGTDTSGIISGTVVVA